MKKLFIQNYQIISSVAIFSLIFILHIPFYKAVIVLLEFIVVIEVVKMLSDFIEKRKLRLRFIIDVFIVFLIRDVIIKITKPSYKEHEIFFLLFVIFIFFIFRILALVYSPSITRKQKNKNS
jgi:uncharacterized membrane protein (DUF373 family)